MKIGELASKTGLTERMLRHYEALGILSPVRSSRGTRDYSDVDLDVALLIKKFRSLDVRLEAIAEIAEERKEHLTGHSSQQAVSSLLNGLADLLVQKAERSLALHRVVQEASQAVQACRGCGNKPTPEDCPDCPMNNAVRRNPVAAMIWTGK